jgi:hypothetical protein
MYDGGGGGGSVDMFAALVIVSVSVLPSLFRHYTGPGNDGLLYLSQNFSQNSKA